MLGCVGTRDNKTYRGDKSAYISSVAAIILLVAPRLKRRDAGSASRREPAVVMMAGVGSAGSSVLADT